MDQVVNTVSEVKLPENTQGVVQNAEVNKEISQEQKVENQEGTKEQIPVTEEAFKEYKTFYENQLKEIKKQKEGLDRKVSELKKIVDEKQKAEMTEEQKKELQKREIRDMYHNLYIQQTIAEFNLKKDDEFMDFTGFFSSDEQEPEKMQSEIKEKGKNLRDYLDRVIKAGIERGVNERLAQGYMPKTGVGTNKVDDFENMTKDELQKRVIEITKMPPSAEKTSLLNKLMMEQSRRISLKSN